MGHGLFSFLPLMGHQLFWKFLLTGQEHFHGSFPQNTGPVLPINNERSLTMMMELSNMCFVLVFECGRPGLQSSTLLLLVHLIHDGRPWIELSENDKSVPLRPVFQLNMQNKIQISSYLRSSSKSVRLRFTGAIEKAETQRQ